MTNPPITERMIIEYCRKRVAPHLPPAETEALRRYLFGVLDTRMDIPRTKFDYDWKAIAVLAGIEAEHLTGVGRHIAPVLDAIGRSLVAMKKPRVRPAKPKKVEAVPMPPSRKASLSQAADAFLAGNVADGTSEEERAAKPKRKYEKRPIEEFPVPLWTEWVDPATFAEALNLHIERHGDSVRHLYHAVARDDRATNHRTMMKWAAGDLMPRSVQSLEVLSRIERRYRLQAGYFKAKLPHPGRARIGHALDDFTAAERRRLAWHLPDDFNFRTGAEQEEILAWVNKVIISGSTEYRAFQAAAMKHRYAVRFRAFQGGKAREAGTTIDEMDEEMRSSVVDAPPDLEREMAALLKFKTSTLTQFGFQRNGVWGDETASQKVEHLGLMFGALAASPKSAVRGYGASLDDICMAVLVFPSTWDWYLQWREGRRGFFTKWEADMLALLSSMVKEGTGWIRQTPSLADRLRPIDGLISEGDIAAAKPDWAGTCDAMHRHARQRLKEIQRVARVHRDPFEPILSILEAESPVGEYRKITEEILRHMPDERIYPRPAAEAVRAFLMLRLGLHTGLRQRNLRELRVCLPGHMPTSERHLEDMKCGELRWSAKEHGWEVLIPSIAFKNALSSFFGQKPFRLILPDLAGLYDMIEAYLDRHRTRLLGHAADPGTFFVKTVKQSSARAA